MIEVEWIAGMGKKPSLEIPEDVDEEAIAAEKERARQKHTANYGHMCCNACVHNWLLAVLLLQFRFDFACALFFALLQLWLGSWLCLWLCLRLWRWPWLFGFAYGCGFCFGCGSGSDFDIFWFCIALL